MLLQCTHCNYQCMLAVPCSFRRGHSIHPLPPPTFNFVIVGGRGVARPLPRSCQPLPANTPPLNFARLNRKGKRWAFSPLAIGRGVVFLSAGIHQPIQERGGAPKTQAFTFAPLRSARLSSMRLPACVFLVTGWATTRPPISK